MVIFPIIPIWLMVIICVVLIVFTLKYNKKNILRILMIILVFLINLRIMIPGKGSENLSNDLDVLFVIDSTISMNALDYNGNKTRLSGVKEDTRYIINELEGARFSVISFDNSAKILIPFTYDVDITLDSIDLITPVTELYARGSSLNTPLEAMNDVLKSDTDDKRSKIVFFISDGEITDESRLKSFKELSNYVSGGAVLGYGTTKGGYMKYKNKYSDKENYLMYYSDSGYGKAVSKLDESNLKKISKDLKIDYIKMNKRSDIESKLKQIKNKTNLRVTLNDRGSYKDIYFIFVIPLFLLMILDFSKIRRKLI